MRASCRASAHNLRLLGECTGCARVCQRLQLSPDRVPWRSVTDLLHANAKQCEQSNIPCLSEQRGRALPLILAEEYALVP